jgi:hypothetical protein
MKGDFSRFTYNPSKHYVGVLHQQGRVWLDSDWNEDVLERLNLLRQEVNDIVGKCGVPEPGTAFRISRSSDPRDFQIAAGRCYVDGILCQFDNDTSYLGQPDLPVPQPLPIPASGLTRFALIYLEVWHRLITYLEDDALREVALQGPDTAARLKTIVQVKAVDLPGFLSCADAIQFLPIDGKGTLTTLQPVLAQPPDPCRLPDPGNFTGRENRFYRVQVHDAGDVIGASKGFTASIPLDADASKGAVTLTLASPLSADQVEAANRAAFVTVTDNAAGSERIGLVSISVDRRTVKLKPPGLLNAHTRAGNATVVFGVASFKWSRDNAAFAVGVEAVQSDRRTLTLSSVGRDAATALREGDLIEIADDASELGPARAHLTRLTTDPDPDQLTVVLEEPLPSSFVLPGSVVTSPPSSPPGTPAGQSDRHLVLRRWDGFGNAGAVYDDTLTPDMNLGDGVRIQFGGSDLRPGDYWHFAARSADESIEALTNAPPAGIQRHRCPLAVVSWGPPPLTSPPSSPPASGLVMTVLSDCRKAFPALIHFPTFEEGIHVTGVFLVDPATNRGTSPLVNDTLVQISSFGGIDIQCDANVDRASISRPTCYFSVENPLGIDQGGNPSCYQILNLAGNTSTSSNFIKWRPTARARNLLVDQIIPATPPNDPGILARLILKGNFIWDQATKSLYLNGETFGTGVNGVSTSLNLPSGDKRRGGDFEMWFWLVVAPAALAGIQASPDKIFAGAATTITITLTAAAPPGGVPITITQAPANRLQFVNPPASIPGGQSSVSFTAKSAPGSPNTVVPVTITAAITGSPPSSVSTPLTISQPGLTTPLMITPPSISPGGTASGLITLTIAAPPGILPVALSSSDSNVAVFEQPTVTVPVGGTAATFGITGVNPGTATITASLLGSNASAQLRVRAFPKGKEDKEGKEDKDTKEGARKEIDDLRSLDVANPAALTTQQAINPTNPSVNLSSPNEQVPATAQAFIRPEERPPVASRILSDSKRKSGSKRSGSKRKKGA